MDELIKRLNEAADECEGVARERAETEGNGLHYMNTCDWSYAMLFREGAKEIERLRFVLDYAAPTGWVSAAEAEWEERCAHSAGDFHGE
ncbi:MAG: hypothetical protein M0Z85_03735 [Gammaproteobacteria bacterium]|nr:hypothetical protein [Gammaproteobacteria bacterium]